IGIFNLKQYNNVVNQNNRLLDLVLSTVKCIVNNSDDPLVDEDLHHPSLSIQVYTDTNNSDTLTGRTDTTAYNFKKSNNLVLQEHLSLIDWSFLDTISNVDSACDMFYYYR